MYLVRLQDGVGYGVVPSERQGPTAVLYQLGEGIFDVFACLLDVEHVEEDVADVSHVERIVRCGSRAGIDGSYQHRLKTDLAWTKPCSISIGGAVVKRDSDKTGAETWKEELNNMRS